MNLQIINDIHGKPEYVLLPITEYERLAKLDDAKISLSSSYHKEYEEIPYDNDDDDDVIIPHCIVSLQVSRQVSLLTAWRLYREMTQQQVADKLGISQANLSQMEQQGKIPQQKTRERLAEVYQCLPEQLVY